MKNRSGLLLYAVLYIVFLYLPIALLPLFSFNDAVTPSFPLSGFTARWYQALGEEPELRDALLNSLQVAATTSVFATLLGACAARAFTRYKFRGKPAAQGVILAPLFLPEILVGISMLVVLLWLGFELSLATVVLGHVLACLPYCVTVLLSSFEGFDVTLEEASADLGEGPLGTLWRVILPIVMPGIISSLIVSFTISLDEFVLAFFLSGDEATLPIYIWGQLRFAAKLPVVMALGSLMLLASIGLLIISEIVRRRGERRLQPSGSAIP
ncbi:MAG: ABC transporter permease [Aestuariivirgaceae bacterium]|nr:ABC transporter permease [Aestuariivirgaceae bacterium]